MPRTCLQMSMASRRATEGKLKEKKRQEREAFEAKEKEKMAAQRSVQCPDHSFRFLSFSCFAHGASNAALRFYGGWISQDRLGTHIGKALKKVLFSCSEKSAQLRAEHEARKKEEAAEAKAQRQADAAAKKAAVRDGRKDAVAKMQSATDRRAAMQSKIAAMSKEGGKAAEEES
jgi:hypothetical protein